MPLDRKFSRWRASVLFALLALLVATADQLSKAEVRATLPRGHSWPADGPIGGIFSLTHVHNTGMAFGLAQGHSPIFLTLAVGIVIFLAAWQWRLGPGQGWVRMALALQVGGATGNAVDRVRLGHVTDFLNFQVWPVFNLADSAISVGVAILAWHLWKEERAATIARRAVSEQLAGEAAATEVNTNERVA